jgi:fibronectin type 3 domain-containing protein
MNKIIAFLFALLAPAIAGLAATVTLAWDANPEPDIAGYRIYSRTNGGTYATNRFVAVTNGTSGSVSNLSLGVIYRFVATAYNTSGLESEHSNEVVANLPGTPTSPQNLRTNAIILRASLLTTPQLNGLWTVVHTYDDVVFTNAIEMAFYTTHLDLGVVPIVTAHGTRIIPPLPRNGR